MKKDFSDFEGNIYDCLDTTLSKLNIVSKIQFAGESSDQSGDTIYISVIGMDKVGQRITGARVEGDGELESSKVVNTHYQADIQLMIVGSNSFVNSSRLHSKIKSRDDIISVWWQHSIPILSVTNLRRSPQLVETKWVDGFSFDIKVNFIIIEDYNSYTIDKIKWTTHLDGFDGVVEEGYEDPNEGLILFGFEGEEDTLGFSNKQPDGVEGGGIYKTLPKTKQR